MMMTELLHFEKKKQKKCHMNNLTVTVYLLVIFRESRTPNLCTLLPVSSSDIDNTVAEIGYIRCLCSVLERKEGNLLLIQ